MKNIIILFFFIISLVSCKDKQVDFKDHSIRYDQGLKIGDKELENCLKTEDSLIVKEFIAKLITVINKRNSSELSALFNYPINLFHFENLNREKFKENWSMKDGLREMISLDIYDENDELVRRSTIKNTIPQYFKEDNENCYGVQIGIGSGLLLDIKKIKGKLKIISLDVAG